MAEQTQTKAMPLDRDTESGRYTQSYTADMVLNVLEDDGRVSAREIGNTYLWMVSDEEEADQ